MKSFKTQSRIHRILTSVVLLSAFISFSSCTKDRVIASSSITSETQYVSGFDAVEIGGSFTAYVEIGEEESVVLEVNENLHAFIEVYTEGSTLVVRPKNNVNITGSQTHLVVYITTRDIRELDASGASRIYVQEPIEGSVLDLHASGASRIEASVNVVQLNTDISGASEMELRGTATNLDAEISGASGQAYYDLEVDGFTGKLSGASECYLTVHDFLSVEASGASMVYYKGNGQIQFMDLSGASQIVHMQ
jgi:hypothetical protein